MNAKVAEVHTLSSFWQDRNRREGAAPSADGSDTSSGVLGKLHRFLSCHMGSPHLLDSVHIQGRALEQCPYLRKPCVTFVK